MSFARNISNKYGNQLLDTATKTGLDDLKSTPKLVAHKTAEATSEFIGNKIADEIVKTKHVPAENSKNVEQMVIPPGKRQKILKELRKFL